MPGDTAPKRGKIRRMAQRAESKYWLAGRLCLPLDIIVMHAVVIG